jgi:uncharacterized delta-60 repeat protein
MVGIGFCRIAGSILLALGLLGGLAGQVREEWKIRYNGYGNAADLPDALATDSNGNVYVAGRSNLTITLVKYAPDGTQLWVARYTGHSGKVRAIAVDAWGNICLAGAAEREGGNDYLTLKYAPNGTLLWAATYNGYEGAYHHDEATAIAVDNQGNIYVTGTSYGGETTWDDIATLKYDPSGNLMWVARYGEGQGLREEARAIAVDESGNAFVLGRQDSSISSASLTIKYDPAGNPLWVARFTGQGLAAPAALRLDGAGNAFIACSTINPQDWENPRMTMAVVKYSGRGNLEWEAYYNRSPNSWDRARAIMVDEQGNVYVAGTTSEAGATRDFVLVKYDSRGNLLWADQYNSPQNRQDVPDAIALDATGAIVVSGRSVGATDDPVLSTTLKYTPNGTRLWVAQHKFSYSVAPALGVDSAGNITLTGSSYWDFLTVQFNSTGQLRWAVNYNGPSETSDLAGNLLMDQAGNLLVLGSTYGGYDYGSDFVILKVAPDGRMLWQVQFGLGRGSSNIPAGSALDGASNLYVAGSTYLQWGASDILLMKYDPNGNRLWLARYDTPDHANDHARLLAVDERGYAYVVGTSRSSDRVDLLLLRYDPNGNLLWARREGDAGRYPSDMAQDRWGNLYVIAEAGGTWLSKYSPMGERLWTLPLPGWGRKLTVDREGNIYVAGHEGNNRYLLSKYSPAGQLIWQSARPVTEIATPHVGALALDGQGYLAVAMKAGWEAVTLKYTLEGNLVWERRYRGLPGSENYPSAMAFDQAGNLYLTIYSLVQVGNTPPYADWYTLKYTPDGREAWAISFDGELEYDQDSPADLLVDRTGNVYVVGSAYLFPGDSRYASKDIVLIKYRQTPPGDVDGDGCVDDGDLLAVLNDFGRQESGLATDLNRDGIVDDEDLLMVLFSFGSGC